MTYEKRSEIVKTLFTKIETLMSSKGKAYAGTDDTFANFKRNADTWGLSKYQVWGVYAGKHLDAITNAIKFNPDKPVEKTESMEGRVLDAITYLTILYGMLVEDKLINEDVS